MGERKVLNKYYPPDFDASKVPRRKMPKDRQYTVRLMAPFNMRCINCGEYIYKGKKFNAKKETVLDEDYLGLHIFRFYIRCTKCCNAIAFKTDPKNTDYVCEVGATRNFENWREVDDTEEAEEKKAELEEQNPMKALEERTKESKAQMDILDALEEIKELSDKNANVDIDVLIAAKEDAKEKLLEKRRLAAEADDDERARAVFSKRKVGHDLVKRLDSSDDDDEETGGGEAEEPKKIKKVEASASSSGFGSRLLKKPRTDRASAFGIVVKSKEQNNLSVNQPTKPKPTVAVAPTKPVVASKPTPSLGLGLGLGLDYGSASSSDGE
eukprot:m.167743 g.167743  ORF g.167743 m.167743 type:complete len:325 (-) comp31474_c0_seq1:79-1053(-)